MRYEKYGKNGPEISKLGFGVMRLPPRKKGDGDTVNFSRSVELLRAAMAAGVNLFDSHHFYHNGLSEVAIGKALKGWKGHKIYIQTKTPMYKQKPLKWFKNLIEQALEKTGVDCIDYLLFHSMAEDNFNNRAKQFFKLTDWAINRGYIRYRGFSSHDKPQNVKTFIDTGEFSVMLLSYNYVNPEMRDMIAYAADKGMGVSIMNPVAGGLLSTNTKQVLRLLPRAKTASEIALRYVLDTPGITTVLSGMNTQQQVKENVRIAGQKTYLTPRQKIQLKVRLKEFKKKAYLVCTGCGYCMPCSSGVDIVGSFRALNSAKLLALVDGAKQQLGFLESHPAGDRSPSACKQCGKCLKKCPNNIEIIEQLEQAALLMKG